MGMEDQNENSVTITQFLSAIYQDLTGYCYIATRIPNAPKGAGWVQKFFNWPSDKYDIAAYIQMETLSKEVYYAPALFNQPSSKKEHYSGSKVVWCEFDGEVPSDIGGIPLPTIRVRSSTPDHEHWYWVLNTSLSKDDLEKINRSLTYSLGADYSGWDCNQVLRPIDTINHKRGARVLLISGQGGPLDPSTFDGLYAPPPPIISTDHLGEIPTIQQVFDGKTLPANVMDLFLKGVQVGSRSHGLMALGYGCAENGFTGAEIYAVVLDADDRWGKFKGRSDRDQRLLEIVSIAKTKYPNGNVGTNKPESDSKKLTVYGFNDFLEVTQELEWIVENTLHKGGFMLIAGPPGVGKSQFGLSLGQHIVLQKSFIGRSIVEQEHGPLKVGFVSLEMNLPELKYFIEQQASHWSLEERAVLQNKMKLIPVGEPIYLNRQDERVRVENMIREQELDVVIIDSLGSATEESLISEVDIKKVMDWNDHLRNTYGVATCFVHHPRKATADNRKPNKLADIYGSQYITARARSVLYLWPLINSIELLSLKLSLAPEQLPCKIYRTPTLHFSTELTPHSGMVKALIENIESAGLFGDISTKQGTKPGPGAIGL